jgi:hypothetical protein
MGHSDVLLVLLSPRTFSERFGAGARPVHPILGHGALVKSYVVLIIAGKSIASSAKE